MTGNPCGSCGTVNEADARFCEGCGSALERRCGGCGTRASATARFCRNCGGPLDGPVETSAAGPVRKIVTVLFADLAGSTTFEEKVDAETAREVMGDYHSLLRSTAERHRAGITKYIGDGFMAVWGVPEISAADADHAVDAAVELQERFVDLAARVADVHGEDLALRVAVNTGEVVVGAGDADLVGDALNVAARLESECPHGEVVVGEETWRSTRGRYRYEPLSPVQVKGRVAPVAVYRLTALRTEPADSVPFVGRTHEFRRLHAVLGDAVARRQARLVTVIGDPGVGKSRLAAEFAHAQQDSVILQIRCAAEGTVALAPIVEVLRTRDLDLDLPPEVPERERILRDLRGVIGGVAGSVEETFFGLRRYFEVLAARGALIVVLDDIHWADALLLDFVEHLSEWARDVPILMIALARPELRESRPDLITVGGPVGDAIRLGGLEPAATSELAARVVGSGRLPTELLSRLPSSTGGNPLFVRELIAMLVHDGVLVAENNGWRLTIDVDAIAVPPTIQALLASRLERMPTADRRVLEVASVIGTDFSPAAACALSGAGPREVKASLDRLRRLELAQPSGAYAGDEPVWRFHHILIRDVAYRRLLKSDRAELHERIVDWIEAGGRAAVFESDELVARHLESAHGYRCELRARDSRTAELALRSARCYLSAAKRALERDALVSAASQAARGVALASDEPALQRELLLVGCEAYLSAGDVAAGAALVDQFERVADDALSPWATCYRCQYIVYTDPSRLPEVDERLQPVIDEFVRRGDATGVAKAFRVRANARGRLGRIGDAESDLFEALIAARQCGDHRQITACLGAAPNAALWGPSPAPKAGGRCLDVVRMQRMTTAAPSLEATSLRCLAVLELLRGRPDKARSMLADARTIVAELGLRHGLMETELYAGIIELMVGDPVAAEPYFRTALEGLDSLGVGADAGQAAALLARSVLNQGRLDEADRYAGESERIAGHNLKSAIAWRAVRAEILSAQGRHDQAIALGREAVTMAAATDLVLDCADAWLALSRVLTAAGDRRGAAEAGREAESLYAAKEAVLLLGNGHTATRTSLEHRGEGYRPGSRLTTDNRATQRLWAAWNGGELNYSENFIYDDRRNFSGEPIVGGEGFLSAAQRKLEQYPHVEAPVLASRGERLTLIALHWWDDAGNETTSLDVFELDEAGVIDYHARFDGDDFPGAYRALEERYYRDEGAAFAASGLKQLEFQEAVWTQDPESARSIVQPDFAWCAEPSTLKSGEMSLEELFARRAQRLDQVAALEDWLAVVRWVSPTCVVGLVEITAVGRDDERYVWNSVVVSQIRGGLLASVHEFDTEDEAFAFAKNLETRSSRLRVGNMASEVWHRLMAAVQAGELDTACDGYADESVSDDRRRFSGDPVLGRSARRVALERIVNQYSSFELRTLAVRGELLHLAHYRWSDHAGNQTSGFTLHEIDERGRIVYDCRFDEDDFEGAYDELERRYYTGEGAAFAEAGTAMAAVVTASNRGDFDRVFTELFAPEARVQSRSRTVIPNRTLSEFRSSVDEFNAMVASSRMWYSAVRWLSPHCAVIRQEREALGTDGESYEWSRIYVGEGRSGRVTAFCDFDVEFEDQAFAYAEERVRAAASRLAITNRAVDVGQRMVEAVRAGRPEAAAELVSEHLVYEDRAAARGAFEGLYLQFRNFEKRILAVRGDRLALVEYRWSDESGDESNGLLIDEIGEDGLLAYSARFEQDDFSTAYRELERRYYAGEGAAFAAAGMHTTDFVSTLNDGGVDAALRLFNNPALRFEDRSRALFGDRSTSELRTGLEELVSMVSVVRWWHSAISWLSPSICVARQERRAIGTDGERYAWTDIYAAESCGGVVTWVCRFDVDDEENAFAAAEERMLLGTRRLPVSNRASATRLACTAALQAGEIDSAADMYGDDYAYEDYRRFSGNVPVGRDGIRRAFTRLRNDYSHFGGRVLAVRGDHLVLGEYVCSDDAGNRTTGLSLTETDADGRICFEGRFDLDDFHSALAEFERRYYLGEGAGFSESGQCVAPYLAALNKPDFDTLFSRLSTPDFRIESRSHSVFATRSAAEFRNSLEQLRELVGSQRDWFSALLWLTPTWFIARHQRDAVGLAGEEFAWERLVVGQFRDKRLAFVCDFDTDDEDAAFGYAEERARASTSRLRLTNQAADLMAANFRAMSAGNVGEIAYTYREDSHIEDLRRWAGHRTVVTKEQLRGSLGRILDQFDHFEWMPLAVRGQALVLGCSTWSDDSGNRSADIHVVETDENGRIARHSWFDDDDFESAYHELERRFFAGEGAEFAGLETIQTVFVDAINRRDLDAALRVCHPSLQVQSPPTTLAVESRSLPEFFRWLTGRAEQAPSVRHWLSAIRWLSTGCGVARIEIRAVGPDCDEYSWPRIGVLEVRGGLIAGIRQFDVDDEDAAFAYAEGLSAE